MSILTALDKLEKRLEKKEKIEELDLQKWLSERDEIEIENIKEENKKLKEENSLMYFSLTELENITDLITPFIDKLQTYKDKKGRA